MMPVWILAHGGVESFWGLFLQWPPLHPILVNLTAGLIPAAVAFDLASRVLRRPSLASAGFWMTELAAAVTPFTALAGWLWMRQMGPMGAGQAMAVHKWTGIGLAMAFILLAVWRAVDRRRAVSTFDVERVDGTARRVGPSTAYLATASLLVLALVFQGHLGGVMSFGGSAAGDSEEAVDAHHSGTAPTTKATEPTDDGWRRGIRVGEPVSRPAAAEGHPHDG